jgi:hypothetical protein
LYTTVLEKFTVSLFRADVMVQTENQPINQPAKNLSNDQVLRKAEDDILSTVKQFLRAKTTAGI